MTLSGCVVVERETDWLLTAGNEVAVIDAAVSPSELARRSSELLKTCGIKNPTCILAPSSKSCFFANLSVADDVDPRDRTTLTFELEDHLPIDAESMVADFMPLAPREESVGNQFAALAIELARWRELVNAFEASDLPVRSIIPAAVLAGRHFSDSHAADEDLIFVDGDQCDWISLSPSGFVAWKHLQVEPQVLRRHQRMSERDVSCTVIGASESQQKLISGEIANVTFIDDEFVPLVIEGAEIAFADRWDRWFDLRRSALAPGDPLRAIAKQLRYVAITAAACLLVLTVGGWWRTSRINDAIDQVRTQQSDAFRTAFPNSRIPVALLTRVRSEHSKVLGSRGKSAGIDVPQSAPDVLRALLSGLPSDVRWQVTMIDITNGVADVTVRFRQSVDIGIIATSIKAAGFEVSPPDARQIDSKTYESVLHARWLGHLSVVEDSTIAGTEANG